MEQYTTLEYGKRQLLLYQQKQGVVTPIGPVLTTATAVKLFDRPKRALTV